MSDQPLFRRDQLAKFLPSFELIKAFEALAEQALVTTPESVVDIDSIVYSLARKPSTSQQDRQIADMLKLQQHRSPNLTDIYNQLAEIKAFIGMP